MKTKFYLKPSLTFCMIKENGYENADKLHSSSFEVPEMGWMHAVYIMEEKIPTIEVLKTKVLEYFKNHKI